MAGEITNNKHLINAPAGSGKTTHIRRCLKSICLKESKSKILCITYTNRAADELKKDLDSANVTVSTIHSYINDLISPFYPLKEAIDLYWEIFKEKIKARIENDEKDEHIEQSNQHYVEKYGTLNVEFVRENLHELSYGETPFTSLYLGKLSHDDLILFANKLIKKYPVLLRKISDKYNYIFIDEYQDTSAYILDIFYDAVKNKENVQLYLLGDRMQQIYRNYDGSFEGKLKEFDTSQRLVVNHRSIGKIISILNMIYNDDSFKQHPSEDNKDVAPDISPRAIITSNVTEAVEHFQTSFPGILTLYLMNKEKYEEIGAKNLYSAYEKMEAYSFGRKYSPTDVLSDMSNDNPDALMKFLFLLNNIMMLYSKENYGMLISVCRKENRFFNSSLFQLKRHTDKKVLRDKFEAVKIVYERENCLIKDVIECLFEQSLISTTVKNIYEESAEYQQVLDIEIEEIKNLANYLNTPHISTQHGVKGESHPSVIFVAADNYSTPNVRMYSFFELWSRYNISLPEFEDLFYSYSKIIMEVEAKLGMRTSELNAETHNKNETNKKLLAEYSNQVLNTYRDNKLFEALLKDDFTTYLAKSTVGNAKNIFKISKIEGILTAYKLFYVGCSRARKNLVIVIDENKINKFENDLKTKLISTGFEIQSFPTQLTTTS
ncbi:MAG: UvrD-helicase domain-containing protein [Candidatus Gastranaerophilaceae bacterium]